MNITNLPYSNWLAWRAIYKICWFWEWSGHIGPQPRANNSNQSLNSAEGIVQWCANGTHYFAEGAGLPKALARRLTHACNQALAVAVLALHACAYYLVLVCWLDKVRGTSSFHWPSEGHGQKGQPPVAKHRAAIRSYFFPSWAARKLAERAAKCLFFCTYTQPAFLFVR